MNFIDMQFGNVYQSMATKMLEYAKSIGDEVEVWAVGKTRRKKKWPKQML
ncbi:hypothetical protein SAMN05444955_11938 [Lihuaxuella thermophila]|uniref:Uncharacterized protein n=1 Tax=Lihuaxuella thermophila TaxID=1173111 RepID=A0A1H8IU67_9BACL|nr:hypothetical protein SAMN05444955_11938 [Lihuaxuella thermophila]